MSNIFKQNSRFKSLTEDISTSKEINKNNNNKQKNNKINETENRSTIEENTFKRQENTFKKSYNEKSYNRERNSLTNKYSKEQIERFALEDKNRKEEAEKLEKERLTQALSIDKFPELFVKNKTEDTTYTTTTTTTTTTTSFMDKLKASFDIKNDNLDPLNEEYINLKPGWTSIKKDKLTNNITIVIKPSLYIKPEPESESEMAYEVLNALCDLHERRTDQYIEEYGYDTWDKTFRYQDYDYDWVDKLDQEYEAEMEKMMMEEDDPDYITDPDRYNKYWEQQ